MMVEPRRSERGLVCRRPVRGLFPYGNLALYRFAHGLHKAIAART